MEIQILIYIQIAITIIIGAIAFYSFRRIEKFKQESAILNKNLNELKRLDKDKEQNDNENEMLTIFRQKGLKKKYQQANATLDYNEHGIYVKYHKLSAIWVSKFLYAYSNLHTILHLISDEQYEQADMFTDEYFERRHYKYPYLYFERTNSFQKLLIEQIETGNSVIFKTKDGWLPEIDSKDGDIILTLPKKVAPMVYTGILVSALSTVGITNYKNLHQGLYAKNQNEKIELENAKIQSEVELLQSKIRQRKRVEKYINIQLKAMKDTINHPDIKEFTFVQKDNLRIENN